METAAVRNLNPEQLATQPFALAADDHETSWVQYSL
jgi:hypothetical protein